MLRAVQPLIPPRRRDACRACDAVETRLALPRGRVWPRPQRSARGQHHEADIAQHGRRRRGSTCTARGALDRFRVRAKNHAHASRSCHHARARASMGCAAAAPWAKPCASWAETRLGLPCLRVVLGTVASTSAVSTSRTISTSEHANRYATALRHGPRPTLRRCAIIALALLFVPGGPAARWRVARGQAITASATTAASPRGRSRSCSAARTSRRSLASLLAPRAARPWRRCSMRCRPSSP